MSSGNSKSIIVPHCAQVGDAILLVNRRGVIFDVIAAPSTRLQPAVKPARRICSLPFGWGTMACAAAAVSGNVLPAPWRCNADSGTEGDGNGRQ
jgi:hypothetical protein